MVLPEPAEYISPPRMSDPRLLCVNACFGIFGVLFILLCVAYSIHNYKSNEDWTNAELGTFHEATNDIYPSVSLCVNDGKDIRLFETASKVSDEENKEINPNKTDLTYELS